MKLLRCQQCGAPAHPEADVDRYECPFCHSVFTLNRPRPEDDLELIAETLRPPPAPSRAVGALMLLPVILPIFIIGLTASIIGVVFYQVGLIQLPFSTWDGAEPLVCAGNERMEIKGVTARLPYGPVIEANGNCQLTLVECVIEGPTAIYAAGNARVRLERGSVTGADFAFDLGGNAQVEVRGAAVSGPRRAGGNARVHGD
ncbi:MAG: hypothetical protein H6739_20120 [Alphaproteobacteria bacterium]|nr:hypothetical protein [Alphaproteobacteria bacterium]